MQSESPSWGSFCGFPCELWPPRSPLCRLLEQGDTGSRDPIQGPNPWGYSLFPFPLLPLFLFLFLAIKLSAKELPNILSLEFAPIYRILLRMVWLTASFPPENVRNLPPEIVRSWPPPKYDNPEIRGSGVIDYLRRIVLLHGCCVDGGAGGETLHQTSPPFQDKKGNRFRPKRYASRLWHRI